MNARAMVEPASKGLSGPQFVSQALSTASSQFFRFSSYTSYKDKNPSSNPSTLEERCQGVASTNAPNKLLFFCSVTACVARCKKFTDGSFKYCLSFVSEASA